MQKKKKKNKNKKNNKIQNYNNKKIKKVDVNIDSFEDQKPKKGNRIIGKIFKAIIIVILLGAGSAFALTSPYFNISSIEVHGNEKITDSAYVRLSKLKVNTNIFKFKKSDIISNIKKNSYVEAVRIKRALPNKVEITIKERKTKFLIQQNDEYIYLDENGNILEISSEKKDLAILTGITTEAKNLIEGNKLKETDVDRMQDVTKIQNAIQNNEIEQFDIVDISNKFDYILFFEKEAKKVHVGDVSDLETKILYMKYILEEQEGIPGAIYLNQSKVYFSPE